MKTKQELNADIAEHLGFKRSSGKKYQVNGKDQWTYPPGIKGIAQGGTPNTGVPDFIQMIQSYLEFMHLGRYGGPREKFNDHQKSATRDSS